MSLLLSGKNIVLESLDGQKPQIDAAQQNDFNDNSTIISVCNGTVPNNSIYGIFLQPDISCNLNCFLIYAEQGGAVALYGSEGAQIIFIIHR